MTNKKEASPTPTHRVVKRFDLSRFVIEPHTELDLSDGYLRLPEATIRQLEASGIIQALDERAVVKRQIDLDAIEAGRQSEVEMVAGIQKINANLHTALKELYAERPNHGQAYIDQRHRLEAEAFTLIDALQAARKDTLKTIEAARLEKQASL